MKRIRQLQRLLSDTDIDALLLDKPIDLLYLANVEVSCGSLLLTKWSARLFLDARYYESAKEQAPCPITLLTHDALSSQLAHIAPSTLGFDKNNTSVGRCQQLRTQLRKLRREQEVQIVLKGIDNPVNQLRLIKDDNELVHLRRAARLGSQGFAYAKSLLTPGITELEVAKELEIYWLRKGGEGLAFDPIIAFGTNSSKPHYHPGKTRLKSGMPVLIDCGVVVNHYHSDMTRTLFFGQPSKELRTIYRAVHDAQAAALALCKPGVALEELDATAREVLGQAGYADHFTHSLGHGIGLEIHEKPVLRQGAAGTLQAGMVVTIEPGVYLPGKGGVRIEDTVVITAVGHDNLTRPSKTLQVINPH